MNDPISDMLARIQNGYRARKGAVVMPYSRIKDQIAQVLEARAFIAGVERKGRKVRKFLEVRLRYDGTVPSMAGFRRISKPSRRLYLGTRDIRPVRQGLGVLLLSTSRGLMTGEQARRSGTGGEVIAEVW